MCTSARPDLKELKKELCRLFIEVNKEIYGYGVTEIKVSLVENMIIFQTKDNRVHVLKILEERNLDLKKSVDQILFDEFKERLYSSLKRNMNLSPVAVFRDFDSVSRMAVTVAVFDQETSKLYI